MPSDIANTVDFLTALMNAIIEGRIEAKTFRDMTPEQRDEYRAKLIAEEKDEIRKGLERHEGQE
jgi:hypothetical protein